MASVYSTAVPVIVSLKIRIPCRVKANASVLAVSEVLFRRRKEVSYLNTIALGNETADGVSVTWFLQRELYNVTGYPQNKTLKVHSRIWNTLDGNYTKTSSVFLFVIPGVYHVCVLARNLFSQQKKCVPVDVVVPLTGLQLVAIFFKGTILGVTTSSLSVPLSEYVQIKYAISSGSKPRFLVNLGNRTFHKVYNMSGPAALSSSCLVVSPVFKSCGKKTIVVKAVNDFSVKYLRHLLVVHPFTEVLEFEKPEGHCIFTRVNTSVTLKATVGKGIPFGCKMSFEWNFNDSSSIVITNGELY